MSRVVRESIDPGIRPQSLVKGLAYPLPNQSVAGDRGQGILLPLE